MLRILLLLQVPFLIAMSFSCSGFKRECFSCNFRREFLQREETPTMGAIKKSAEEFKRKYQIKVTGTGGCVRDGKKTSISIGFETRHPMKKEEWCKVIVECTQQFLKDINSDAKLEPYLSEKPYTYKHIEIKIFISNPDGSSIFHPGISVTSLVNGEISYSTVDPENRWRYKSDEYESYEEALQKVQVGNELE